MSPSTMQASLSRHVLLPWSRLRPARARPGRTREGFQRLWARLAGSVVWPEASCEKEAMAEACRIIRAYRYRGRGRARSVGRIPWVRPPSAAMTAMLSKRAGRAGRCWAMQWQRHRVTRPHFRDALPLVGGAGDAQSLEIKGLLRDTSLLRALPRNGRQPRRLRTRLSPPSGSARVDRGPSRHRQVRSPLRSCRCRSEVPSFR